MQELQPEVKAIQDRYAKLKMSDPARQKMNAEMMSLYRERGVNPASGCVPMLLTLPVLFAFYSMLSVAIELRGAPFVGWIHDLSVYDPLFITPVLMGITQFVQTKMTPSTADPMQQKMMLFMPLIFMSMFIWAPSGLVLYWTVEQSVGDRTAGVDQPADRPASRSAAQAPARAAGEERRRRQDRLRRVEGAQVMELHERVREFTRQTVAAMGVPLDVAIDRDARQHPRRALRRRRRSARCGAAAKRSTRSSRSSTRPSAAS